MTPTEAAIKAEIDRATVDGVVRVSVELMNHLIAQRDRYEKALRDLVAAIKQEDIHCEGEMIGECSEELRVAFRQAQEALRCE